MTVFSLFCRFASDSPTSDIDGRTPKGRGKRGRTCVTASRSDMNGSDRKLRSNRCATGKSAAGQSSGGSASPVRSESGGMAVGPPKRPRGVDVTIPAGSNSDNSRANSKSSRSDSRTSNAECDVAGADALIECTAPNCSKKYRHANGLRYHQSRAHPDMVVMNDEDENNDDMDGSAKSTDSDQQRLPSAGKFPRPKMSADDADSVSDGDVWQVTTNNLAVDGGGPQPSDSVVKSEKKSKKVKTVFATDLQEAPASPSCGKLITSKSFADETPTSRDKPKHHRKKERDRVREVSAAAADNVPDSDAKLCLPLVSVTSERLDDGVTNDSLDVSAKQPASQLVPALHGGPFPVSEGIADPVPTSDSNFLATVSASSAFVPAVQPKSEIPDSSLNLLTVDPAKKPKATPLKHLPDQDNPNSPAYSDISDANDAAPMLEKEATPSTPLDEEEILPSGNIGREQRPLSRHVQDTFGGNFSRGTSSALYSQPPCLTPAVASASMEEAGKQPGVTIPSSGGQLFDDRHLNGANPPPSRPQPDPGIRSIVEAPSESADRSLQRSMPRFSAGGDSRSSPLPAVFPTQMLMAYQYMNPNLDAAMLMQHPEYRAHYERLIQQEVTRRHDSPSLVPHPSSPDIKGSPASRPGEADRRVLLPGKLDPAVVTSSLPTPPSLIPDRLDDHESLKKTKGAERREDAPRVYAHPHPPGGGSAPERIRRQEETSVSKEGLGGKPSAVVAPQARDRNAPKIRPDDRPRPGGPPPPSPHDQTRTKPAIQKGIPTSHQVLQLVYSILCIKMPLIIVSLNMGSSFYFCQSRYEFNHFLCLDDIFSISNNVLLALFYIRNYVICILL